MVKKLSAIIFVLVVTAAMCVVLNDCVYAGNGTRMLGFSARDSAMGGATTASSEDTSCLVRNPAGLVLIGNRIDAEYLNMIPHGVSMNTEGRIVTPPVSLSNIGREQSSTVRYIPGVDIGVSYRIPGTDSHPVSVGIGAFTMCGIAVAYPSSRLNGALIRNNVYDRQVDLRSMRIAPGLAVGITDKLSFGATGNIAIQGLRTDLATSPAPLFTETTGAGNWDFTPGGGFTLGLLYVLNDMLNLGASYESHGWMQHHKLYLDTLPYIDEPPVINAGISLKPIKNLELTYDTRYINWTDVKLARIKPNEGGFGWQDQWVFATGGEYTTLNDKLKLRLGYNYGKSPVQDNVVFANALFPIIMEHHVTTGFSYSLTKNFSLDFTWEHHFMGVKVDNGCGDVYSQNGVGTKISAAADIISLGMGYKF